MKRIALVRLTALGDIIHTAASLQFIKAAFPYMHLSWFVEEKFVGILEHNPHIDEIIPLDLQGLKKDHSFVKIRSITQAIKKSGPFDLIIDVQGLIKSAVIARIAGKNVAGLDRHSAREGIVSFLYRHRYLVDCAGIAPMRFANLIAQALGIEISQKMMEHKSSYLFFDPKRGRSEFEEYFASDRPNILIVTAAGNPSKTYPLQQWIEVIRELKENNILLTAGSDIEWQKAEQIARQSSARLFPIMDLDNLKYTVSRCDLLIGGDTGPSHIAWAMGCPSILLFGSTPRSMMFETEQNIALASGAPIRPCRFDKSDRSIATIEPERVCEHARNILHSG